MKFKVWDSVHKKFVNDPEKFFINHKGQLCDIFDGTPTMSQYTAAFSNEEIDKAVSFIKRLIEANAREGWENSETFSKVAESANGFIDDFEFYKRL